MTCTAFVMGLPLGASAATAVYFNLRAMQHGLHGRPAGFAAFKPSSYDAVGARYLRLSLTMAASFLPLILVSLLVAHLLCPSDFN